MGKIASIVLSLCILLQSFNIHFDDLLELDALIEHAQFHSEEYGDDFFVFISKHYGELKAEHHKQNREEQDKHDQLPFQHQTNTALSAFVLTQESFYTNLSSSVQFKLANFFYQATYHSRSLDRLLDPPRQA